MKTTFTDCFPSSLGEKEKKEHLFKERWARDVRPGVLLVCYFKNWREGAGEGWISCPMLYNDYRCLGETGKDPT